MSTLSSYVWRGGRTRKRGFTGQLLDGTGFYYYNARYYDPTIGRFISADTVVPYPANPQNFNRYSYFLNNPLKYVDPSGHIVELKEVVHLCMPGVPSIYEETLAFQAQYKITVKYLGTKHDYIDFSFL